MKYLKIVKRLVQKNKRTIAIFASLLALSIPAFFIGKNIPYSEQLSLFEGLRNTAAIIFTVLGIWLAIIYPDSLKSKENTKKNSENHGIKIEWLINPIAYSLITLILLLVLQLAAPALYNIPRLKPFTEIMQGVYFSILITLALLQIIIIFITLIPAAAIIINSREQQHQDRINNKVHKSNPPHRKNNK